MPERERALIEACIHKQDGAWKQFVATYRSSIRASVHGTRFKPGGEGLQDADDLESYIYEKLLENDCHRLRAWRSESRFSTYLVVVTRNLVRDYLASVRTRSFPTEELSQADYCCTPFTNSIEEIECEYLREQAVHSALCNISDKQAAIIRLRLSGKTLKEIAELTKRPMGTVSVENSRALDRIRSYVASHLAVPVQSAAQ